MASVVPRDGGGSQFTALVQPQRVMDTRSGVGRTTGTANPGNLQRQLPPGVKQANEVLTAINGSRQVTLFVGGGGTPLTHVVVDVVGYLTSTG